MIDEQTFREELRNLKALIHEDPEVLARYDLNGDGEISGEEWDHAVELLRQELERQTSAAAAAPSRAAFQALRGATAGPSLVTCREVVVRQQVDARELLRGYETSNRYTFLDAASGAELGGADEDHGGVSGFLSRQFFGAERPLNLTLTDTVHRHWMEARRPYSPLAFLVPTTMTVDSNEGLLGTVRRVWPLVLRRRYRVCVANQVGRDLWIDGSPLRPWTFPVMRDERQVACIQKRWSGVGRELFTDADSFRMLFEDDALTAQERRLLIAAALAIDFDFFEKSPGD